MNFSLIIAAGSPSTLLAVAGYCRANSISPEMIRDGKVGVVITQAFQVGPGSPTAKAIAILPEDSKVVLIGLPVNNKEPTMTSGLVRSIGTRLVGVYDEHEADRWAALREELNLPAELFHTPGKGDGHLSAASIIGSEFQDMPRLWVEAGDWADNRSITVSPGAKALATAIDNAVKARIADNQFRVIMIRHLLGDSEATAAFEARLAEGKAIEDATSAALVDAKLEGNVLVVNQPNGQEINQTAAMFGGYKKAPFVAVVGAKSGEGQVVVVGVNDKHPTLGKTDLLKVFTAAGLKASGIAGKATVQGLENLDRVVEALNGLK